MPGCLTPCEGYVGLQNFVPESQGCRWAQSNHSLSCTFFWPYPASPWPPRWWNCHYIQEAYAIVRRPFILTLNYIQPAFLWLSPVFLNFVVWDARTNLCLSSYLLGDLKDPFAPISSTSAFLFQEDGNFQSVVSWISLTWGVENVNISTYNRRSGRLGPGVCIFNFPSDSNTY